MCELAINDDGMIHCLPPPLPLQNFWIRHWLSAFVRLLQLSSFFCSEGARSFTLWVISTDAMSSPRSKGHHRSRSRASLRAATSSSTMEDDQDSADACLVPEFSCLDGWSEIGHQLDRIRTLAAIGPCTDQSWEISSTRVMAVTSAAAVCEPSPRSPTQMTPRLNRSKCYSNVGHNPYIQQ